LSQDKLTRREMLGATLAIPAVRPAAAGLFQASSAGRSGRVRESFDFGWKFYRGDPSGAASPAFNDSNWRLVDLPHDWSIEGPYAESEPTGGPGGYLPTGIGWYRKRFRAADDLQTRKVFIEFDGIYQRSEIWINGQPLGGRPYGYTSFGYDLTSHLKPREENVIAVRVDNSAQPNSRWYSGSGIYRHVWLIETGPVHVARWGTYITTPEVSAAAARINVRTRVQNETRNSVRVRLTSRILDHQKNEVASTGSVQDITPHGEYEFIQDVKVSNPGLWNPQNPCLYTGSSEIHMASGELADEYETTFGIREIRFDRDRGFLLNGRPTKLNGVCNHHEAGSVGAAVPERVWERRLQFLKDMGCNAIRMSHNPPAPELLDLCDRMGFLVMDENFDEWRYAKGQVKHGYHELFDQWWRADTTDMVHRDRNHPCIVLWSAGNEIPDQDASDGTETVTKLVGLFHEEDPMRPVTAACDHIASEPKAAPPEFLAQLDVVGYNYVDRWRDRREKYYSIDRHLYPERKFVGTESTAFGGVRGDYSWLLPGAAQNGGFYGRMLKNILIDVEQRWKFVRTYDYVAGDFIWTGFDYLGEARWPAKGASSGVIDTCGFKKDGYFFYQSQWTDTPVLHLFPHWNWSGREGQVIPVTCFTNCETVELFVNGKSFGVKGYAFPRLGMEKRYGYYPPEAMAPRTTADLHLSWDVPYEPGTIRAVGMKNGRVAASTEIWTTGAPAAVKASPDRSQIVADRRDVAHIVVEIVDDSGRTVPTADNDVTFAVEGPAKLIGVDNGNPVSHENYKGISRHAFNGRCLAIVQSTRDAGQFRVTANSPSLQPGSCTVEVVKA
jgi:beta-galactosidase